MNEPKQRTSKQNRSLHKFCTDLAQVLNSSGLSMTKVLKPSIEIEWSQESVKKYLWHPIQDAMFDKVSTADLTTDQVAKVYEVLNRHLGEKFKTHVPFPTEEPPLFNPLPE